MDLEDQYRFQVEPAYDGSPWIAMYCDRCRWHTEIGDALSLRDLIERAEEHAEVCTGVYRG